MEHEGGDMTARTTAELLGATPSMVDSASAELLRIAQDGGLAKNVRYTYKGKLVKFFRVTGNDYAKAVGEFRTQRKYGRRQIGLRVCQLIAFVATVLTIAIATWYLTLMFDELQVGFLDEAVPAAEQLRPAIPRLEKVVQDLIPVVGTLQKGVDTAGEVVDGVRNVTDVISSNATAEYVSDVARNATSVVEPALNDLGEAAQSIGTSVQGVLSGNQTVQEGLSTVGDAFSSFGNNLVDGLQQTGSQIAEASQDIFCSALSFLCP